MNASPQIAKLTGGSAKSSRRRLLTAALLVAIPPILFYSILLRKALNVPILDDYDVFLDFLNQISQIKGIPAKAAYFVAAQHNEYKLYFAHALAWLQLAICGHLDLRPLCAVGDGTIFLLGILLWKMFAPGCKDLATRLALFIPVSCLLFQLEYFDDLYWTAGALQHLPVLVFSLGSIYFLGLATPRAFAAALALLVLAIGTSGNGFLAVPIGVLILAPSRCYPRIAGWLAVSAGCVVAYAYHYNVMSSQVAAHRSIVTTVLRMRPAYIIGFIGNAAGIPYESGSFIVGGALCLFFAWMLWRGYMRRNAPVGWCVLFLLLTAVGVAGIRSDLGTTQSVQSRYMIYSSLLLIFAWFATVEEFLLRKRGSIWDSGLFLSALAATLLFAVCMDGAGFLVIELRDRMLIESMSAFEHAASLEAAPGPAPVFLQEDAAFDEFNLHARAILIQSIRLGIYRPPKL